MVRISGFRALALAGRLPALLEPVIKWLAVAQQAVALAKPLQLQIRV
jgi:hypothetical protein